MSRAPSRISGINWASPLAQGLQSAGFINEGTLEPIDYAVDTRLSYYSNKADSHAGQLGRDLRFNDSSRNSEALLLSHLGSNWADGATDLTMGVVVRWHGLGSGTTDEDCLLGQFNVLQGTADINAARVLLRYDSGANQVESFTYDGSASDNDNLSVNIEDGDWYWIALRLSGGTLTTWVNGVGTAGTAAEIQDPVPSHSKVPELMGGNGVTSGSGSDAPRADLKSWFISERAWSDGEMRAWHSPQHRWDIFRTGYRLITIGTAAAATATAAVTGTIITGSPTETDIKDGGNTIILTLTNDTWAAAGTGPVGSTADTQAIIDGLTSAQSEGTGWNAEVRDKESTTSVVRTSNTVVTITLSAAAAYDITANETITVTIPAAALVTSASAVVAAPTFDITFVAASAAFRPPSGLTLLGVGM